MKSTHMGGCHCKKVRYTAELDLAEPVLECNCSHCSMKGMLLQFVPADQFTLESGEGSLTEYRFNNKTIAHLSCTDCSVQPFARANHNGVDTVAINVRSIDGVDLDSLTRKPVNGKEF